MTVRYAEDPWLWELDWSVQEIRTKKLKPPKKKRKKKVNENTENAKENTVDSVGHSLATGASTTCDLLAEDEMIDDNNIEVVEGLKSSLDILATIPPASDVMYKRRQNLPGYPK